MEIFLKKTLSLFEDLGSEQFSALLDESNRGKVKEFCKALILDFLPIEMIIGDRVYEILSFLEGSEINIVGHEVVSRAKKMNATLDPDDAEYLMRHHMDIPQILRGRVKFVFSDWCRSGDPDHGFYVYWFHGSWTRSTGIWLGHNTWDYHDRLLRRKV
ncbi:MAG TPA: hypothetical protein PKH95_01375 [Candidatus Magasanikbacteria bacterium]|nr:hypothetical protein [Candidatus Magasanikbacteria bacterium]